MTEISGQSISSCMSEYEGKKNETVTVKVSLEQLKDFDLIAEKNDRSRSYVVRELAIRGLEQYKQDGLLKTGVSGSFHSKFEAATKFDPETSQNKSQINVDEEVDSNEVRTEPHLNTNKLEKMPEEFKRANGIIPVKKKSSQKK